MTQKITQPMLRDCANDVKPVQLSEEVCRGLSSADGVPSSFSSNGWNGAKRLNGWNVWNFETGLKVTLNVEPLNFEPPQGFAGLERARYCLARGIVVLRECFSASKRHR
jgi:hypothetical protein